MGFCWILLLVLDAKLAAVHVLVVGALAGLSAGLTLGFLFDRVATALLRSRPPVD